ncbi:hypothetical protein FOPE_04509 [Fonsecaea pedrosoi]|nr:hypothetical protein FOPE_04509 [Fonsecaea pedrosoi]
MLGSSLPAHSTPARSWRLLSDAKSALSNYRKQSSKATSSFVGVHATYSLFAHADPTLANSLRMMSIQKLPQLRLDWVSWNVPVEFPSAPFGSGMGTFAD